MGRNLVLLGCAAVVAAGIAFGAWYQNRNSPFERCVRAKSNEYAGESIPGDVAGKAIEFCLEKAR